MKPKTRKEIFLDALAKGRVPNIEPVTREEMLLLEQCQREASGGSGGIFELNLASYGVDVATLMGSQDEYTMVEVAGTAIIADATAAVKAGKSIVLKMSTGGNSYMLIPVQCTTVQNDGRVLPISGETLLYQHALGNKYTHLMVRVGMAITDFGTDTLIIMRKEIIQASISGEPQ